MDSSNGRGEGEGINQPLIGQDSSDHQHHQLQLLPEEKFGRRLWVEMKKQWHIVGPAIFSRVASFTMNVVIQVFAGHLGVLPLAAVSIANNVIVGFNFGLLLGMASALETLCGQAFGAKRPDMLGIYLQRSWIVLTLCCFILLPVYVWSGSILKAIGYSDSVAEETELVALWMIPLHFSFAFQFPLQRFLQSQLKTRILAYVAFVALVVDIFLSWLLAYVFHFGVVGLALALDASWWVLGLSLFIYTAGGWCPDTWSGFSWEALAFHGLWEFTKLSAASGVMLCLENWYYRILVLMVGKLKNATIAVDALSICMTINGWEMMIPLAFLAATGVRVANELGAGNGKGARFATIISVSQSSIIGLVIFGLTLVLHDKYALLFSTSSEVLAETDKLSFLLAFSMLLNSVQPVFSGVAIGSGWQAWVAYINLGCYYIVGLPLGIVFGWVVHTGVEGIWAGMLIGGTLLQTLILSIIVARSNWEKEAEKAQKRVSRWSKPLILDETET
ncbi:Protein DETOXIFICATION 27 [Dionaea muscipula]